MRTTRLALAALFALLAACSSIKVASDYPPDTDFSVYETYAWLPHTLGADEDELTTRRVQDAADAELQAKGLRKVAEEDADLRVSYRVSVGEQIQVNDPYYAYAPQSTYDVGTLLIDLVDADTRDLVWRGTAQARLREHKTPGQREQRVREAVRAILEEYPPR